MSSPANEDVQVNSISVCVLLFSVLKERLGASRLDVKLERGDDTSDLIHNLIETYPDVRAYASVVRIAVNEEYVDGIVDLRDGDEVALITPVSGG